MKKGRLFTPISFFPRSRGKMKKGDRKGSSDLTVPRIVFSQETTKIMIHSVVKIFSALITLRLLK